MERPTRNRSISSMNPKVGVQGCRHSIWRRNELTTTPVVQACSRSSARAARSRLACGRRTRGPGEAHQPVQGDGGRRHEAWRHDEYLEGTIVPEHEVGRDRREGERRDEPGSGNDPADPPSEHCDRDGDRDDDPEDRRREAVRVRDQRASGPGLNRTAAAPVHRTPVLAAADHG